MAPLEITLISIASTYVVVALVTALIGAINNDAGLGPHEPYPVCLARGILWPGVVVAILLKHGGPLLGIHGKPRCDKCRAIARGEYCPNCGRCVQDK